MWQLPFSAGNPLPEVFCGCICLFHAASHWKPTVILQLDNTSRPFSSFVISYWWSPNLQQRFCLLLPRYVPWHSVLLSFFPFLLHQPSRSSNISRVIFRVSLSYYRCHPTFCHQQVSWHAVTWNEGCESQVPNTTLGECLKVNSAASVLSFLCW